MPSSPGALHLGRGVSVHPAPTAPAQLRTTGSYRYVRHPMYSGVLVLAAAITLTAGVVVRPVLWLALLVLLSVKARFDEGLLEAAFLRYREFARRAGRFLPKLTATPGR